MVLLLVQPLTVSAAAIYKSTDKNGNLVFSDQPVGDATEVSLDPVQTYQQKSTAASAPKPASPTEQKSKKANEYTAVAIASPANNSTFWIGTGPIAVTATLTPSLQTGDEAVLLYDGVAQSPITGPAASLNFSITDYTPGKHSIAVEIYQTGKEKKVLKTSNSVSFYALVHRNDQN